MGGSGTSSSFKEWTHEDVVREMVGEDSYALSEEYNEMKNYVDENRSRAEDLGKQMRELDEKIREEIDWSSGDADDIALVASIDMGLADDMGYLTAEGSRLYKEYSRIKKEKEKVENLVREYTEKIERLEREAYRKQADIQGERWGEYKGGIKGFSDKLSSLNYINDLLREGKAYVVTMSPREYLRQISRNIFGGTIERTSGASMKDANRYAKMMRKGTKFTTPMLNFRDREQEGRHRAIAAMINGYKKIPVIIVPQFDSDFGSYSKK